MQLDNLDRRILDALQRNAKLSNVQLAEEVGLSPSPCLRRVRLLEEAGVIRGYHAELDRSKSGLGADRVCRGQGRAAPRRVGQRFRAAVIDLPEVISCHVVSGESDFLLQVVPARSGVLRGLSVQHPAQAARGQRHPQQLRHLDRQVADGAAARSSAAGQPELTLALRRRLRCQSLRADRNARPVPRRPSTESGGTASAAGSAYPARRRQTAPAPSARRWPGSSWSRRR